MHVKLCVHIPFCASAYFCVFVCMYAQERACVSANARVRVHALWSARNLYSNRKHSGRKILSSKLFAKLTKN